jgi:hypothetical protein
MRILALILLSIQVRHFSFRRNLSERIRGGFTFDLPLLDTDLQFECGAGSRRRKEIKKRKIETVG